MKIISDSESRRMVKKDLMKLQFILCLVIALSASNVFSRADETNALSPNTRVVVNLDVNGTASSNTTMFDSSDSYKVVATSIATNIEKYVLACTNAALTNVSPALTHALGVVRTNLSPAIIDAGEAMDLLFELKGKGQLPGVAKDSHGELAGSIPKIDLASSAAKLEAERPTAFTFHIVLREDPFTNHYTIGRTTKDAPLRLQKAWRTDAQDRTIKDWPVK